MRFFNLQNRFFAGTTEGSYVWIKLRYIYTKPSFLSLRVCQIRIVSLSNPEYIFWSGFASQVWGLLNHNFYPGALAFCPLTRAKMVGIQRQLATKGAQSLERE